MGSHSLLHSTHKMVKLAKIVGQPKRPMSAYFLWMNEEGRNAAKKALPGASIGDISKHCGVAWKTIDEADKKKYEKKQAELKKKYDVEYPLWLENCGKSSSMLPRRKRNRRRPAKVRR